jgi:hypothetical protein
MRLKAIRGGKLLAREFAEIAHYSAHDSTMWAARAFARLSPVL